MMSKLLFCLTCKEEKKKVNYVNENVLITLERLLLLLPAKILSPFLCTKPLQYVLKILFTQATIDCLTNNKTKNALHKETVILKTILVVSHLTTAWINCHMEMYCQGSTVQFVGRVGGNSRS